MLQLAQIADREGVNALACQLHKRYVAWRPDLYTDVQELYSEADFLDAIKHRTLYLVKEGTFIAGYVRLTSERVSRAGEKCRKTMTVSELCVDEMFLNQGLGSSIMEDVRALARAFGCEELQLKVYPQTDEAVSFFQKCGFTIQRIEMQMSL